MRWLIAIVLGYALLEVLDRVVVLRHKNLTTPRLASLLYELYVRGEDGGCFEIMIRDLAAHLRVRKRVVTQDDVRLTIEMSAPLVDRLGGAALGPALAGYRVAPSPEEGGSTLLDCGSSVRTALVVSEYLLDSLAADRKRCVGRMLGFDRNPFGHPGWSTVPDRGVSGAER